MSDRSKLNGSDGADRWAIEQGLAVQGLAHEKWQSIRKAATILACGIVLILVASALAGCQKNSQTRVKMTATVTTDSGSYTGSSIQQYDCRHSQGFMGDTAQCTVKGEAVSVKIPGRGYLFLIFDTPGSQSIMSMPYSVLGAVSADPLGATNEDLPAEWTLKPSEMPLMVKFGDLNEAGSVQAVDPTNLALSFGPTVRAVTVKLETTTDSVQTGRIEHILPWLKSDRNQLYYSKNATDFSKSLGSSQFT